MSESEMAKLVTLPLGVNECGWINWYPSMFLHCAQCSWERLHIHHNSDQDKVVTEDK